MRCTSCGLPLSPARTVTSCPRCGTPIVSDKDPSPWIEAWRPAAPQTQVPEVLRHPMAPLGSEALRSQGAHVQSAVTFPLPGQERQLAGDGLPQTVPPPRALHNALPWQAKPPQSPKRSKNNLGFIVAGLCVITGGLILFFVYFMAVGSPGNSTSTNSVKTNTAQTSTSPSAATSAASSPAATPFPGQKYIDNAQMAISIDPTSHQPTQVTTTFKTNQRMYITFQLHPAGQNGAACLLWYMNNKQFFAYPLPVSPNERATYSYASYGGTGSGYVEIYWASTTKCTDKILAQHVDFTITT